MVSQVTLGNYFNLNGKAVLGGAGGSGLDTQSLITGLVAAKSVPVTQNQDQIKVNDAQSTALGTFQTLLSTFQSAADALRNPPGVGNDASNVFKFTSASVSPAASQFVSVTTSPGAALQTYNVSNITQLASSASQTSGIIKVASADAAAVSATPISGTSLQFTPGTITINGQNLTFNEGDSLNTVAADFNAVSANTGIGATVIQLTSGQYQLYFTSTKTGSDNSFNLASGLTVIDPTGVLGNLGLTEQQGTGTFTVADANASVVPPASGSVAFGAGNITLPVLGGGTQIVTINAGDSLNTIAASFNTVAGTTGVAAHVVQSAAGQFQLSFTATQDGATTPFDLSTATADPGVLDNVGLTATHAGTTPLAGKDAMFDINGIPLTRSSNSVSDVVSGVTFNLLQKTTDSTDYPVSIQPDATTVQNTIVNFVSAYNALKTFAAQQTQLNSDGTYATTAVLANNLTFRSTMNDITSGVNALVTNAAINNLSAVGISFTNQPATSTMPEVDNILNVNDGQLSSVLASNFSGVKQLFGFTLTSNNPHLVVFSHTNSLTASSFTLNIDPVNNLFTATYGTTTVNLTATVLTGGSGYTLTGPDGSAIAGLKLIYASNTAASIPVAITSGIADQTYNTNAAALTANTGTLAVALKALHDSDTRLNTDITQLNNQISLYQSQLVAKLSALEQAISKTNSLLSSLNANSNAALTASGH